MWSKTRKTERAMVALLVLLDTLRTNLAVTMRFKADGKYVQESLRVFERILDDRICPAINRLNEWLEMTECIGILHLDVVDDCECEQDDDCDHDFKTTEWEHALAEFRALNKELRRCRNELKVWAQFADIPTKDILAKDLL
jgi:hypothetical protein